MQLLVGLELGDRHHQDHLLDYPHQGGQRRRLWSRFIWEVLTLLWKAVEVQYVVLVLLSLPYMGVIYSDEPV